MPRPDNAQSIGGWLRQPTLSRRLAAALLLSLVAIQAQAFLQIGYFSRPELRLVGTRWLAEAAGHAAREAFALPPSAREAYLAARGERLRVRMHWRQGTAPTGADDGGSMIAARLAATVKDVLGDDLRGLHIRAGGIRFRFPTIMMFVTIASDDVAQPPDRRPVLAGEPDVLIHAGIRVSIEGRDGSWIDVEPPGLSDYSFGSSLPLAPLLVGGLIIAAVSTWTARRIMAPLDRLVVAAERVGTAREPVRVETAGLQEFANVARAFEDMQHRLLRFVEDRTRILAAISHDLRSSLTRLTLAAEQCKGDAERAALATEIADMQTMVESTLSFASGEARLAPTKPTDIAALLISLVDEAADAGKACTYQGPDHIETMGHPVSLKRAFWNVIDNALKYGKGARVALTVDATAVTVRVEDDGPGIPEADLDAVFAPFRRIDPARGHETPGVGLGLTIARDVIQSHGGSIVLANRCCRGLTVTMTLPLR
ncbi:MAG: ATP-binding protein [Hyphomicrobiaceae bacterium]